LNRLAKESVVTTRDVSVRVDWISMAGQRTDHQASVVQRGKEFVSSFFAGEQLVQLDVAAAGPTSRANLQSLDVRVSS
jgi:hypothetical protein